MKRFFHDFISFVPYCFSLIDSDYRFLFSLNFDILKFELLIDDIFTIFDISIFDNIMETLWLWLKLDLSFILKGISCTTICPSVNTTLRHLANALVLKCYFSLCIFGSSLETFGLIYLYLDFNFVVHCSIYYTIPVYQLY